MKKLSSLKGFLENISIKTKLKLFYSLLIIFPLLLIGLAVSVLMKDIIENQIDREANKDSVYSSNIIMKTLDEIDVQILTTLVSDDIFEKIESDNFVEEKVEATNQNEIMNTLENIVNGRKEIEFLMMITKDGRKYYYNSEMQYPIYIRRIKDLKEDFYTSARIRRSQIEWIGLKNKEKSILGVRKLIDTNNLQEYGYIYIGVKNSLIWEICMKQRTTAESFYIIKDNLGNIILDTNMDSSSPINIKESYAYRINEENLGWKIIQYVPTREVSSKIIRMLVWIASITLLFIGVTMLFMNRFAEYLVRPIIQLSILMKEVKQSDNFELRAMVKYKDEVGELSTAFNHMITRINKLIEEEYKRKLMLQETEFKFLQAQINPHFLYNTLDSISWMASIDGNTEVSKMTIALGKLLRWSISNTDNEVYLQEEVAHVKEYLYIQQQRYNKSLNYSIDISEEASRTKVLKMILQPIVENSLMHGLADVDYEKRISISARIDKNQLILKVKDNGIGIKKEKIEGIMKGEVKNHHGIGIYNVHQRIKMMYGEKYGLKILSNKPNGVEVRFTMPTGGVSYDKSYDS